MALAEFFYSLKSKLIREEEEEEEAPEKSEHSGREKEQRVGPVGLMDLPYEMRSKILAFLPHKTLLQVRQTCSQLYQEVTANCSFKMNVYGQDLNDEQREFVSRVNVLSIKFKRLAKAMPPSDEDEEYLQKDPNYKSNTAQMRPNMRYFGPKVYMSVAKVQILMLKSPMNPTRQNKKGKRYDFDLLREFLLNFTGDIFLSLIQATE